MDISIIIVNHNSKEYLLNCLSSIKKVFNSGSYEIIIVNNDSKPLDIDLRDKNIEIFQGNPKLSFGKANNIGASKAKAPLLWFLNPDTEIVSENLENLLKLLKKNSTGAVGMKLLTKKGVPQKWSAGFKITPLSIILSNLGFDKNKLIWGSPLLKEVDWVSGCSFAIKRELFEEIKGFDVDYFMYFEDVDICKRIKERRKKIFFFPDMEILHWGGKSYSNKSLQKKHYYESQRLYLKKHFGIFGSTCIHLLRLLFSA
jgi:GT2 family glycosyltransferase